MSDDTFSLSRRLDALLLKSFPEASSLWWKANNSETDEDAVRNQNDLFNKLIEVHNEIREFFVEMGKEVSKGEQ